MRQMENRKLLMPHHSMDRPMLMVLRFERLLVLVVQVPVRMNVLVVQVPVRMKR